ncbi:MAG: response regulator [Lachnospiraceae bacterium]|nr:response regulator [Lachnospiraceae bacterium]
MKYIKYILSVIVVLVFGYIFIGELVMPENTPISDDICEVLQPGKWVLVLDDGSEIPIELPGRVDGDVVLRTILPKDLNRNISVVACRGMDMQIYVGDELRTDYTIEDYALFGDRSSECYVMAPVYTDDGGKPLTIYLSYNSGIVYEVLVGTRWGIIHNLFTQYGAELMVGLGLLLLSLICLVAAVAYEIIHKRYLEMEHLALGVLIGACWVMSNSIFRQFYSRNMSIMSDTPFLMVILMPIPFLVFINSLQNGRFSKLIGAASFLAVADFVVCISLFLSGKVTLLQSFPISALCALICIIVMFTTLVIDFIRHEIYSYRYVAVGFVLLAIAAVFQILMYQFAHNGVFSGLFMAIGLFAFQICAIIHTIKQLIGIRLVANEALMASKAKDDFLANMSHEIRTPLNGILGMDEMIIRDTRESRIKKYALDIKSAGNTLLSLINDILDLSKIEAGSFEIIPIQYDIASVINDVINITRTRAVSKDLGYNITVAEDTPSVLYGDEIRIRQVMLNIINNAIKYTPSGHIDINISTKETIQPEVVTLIISVSDTGMGIKDEDKDKLFSSFQRLDEKKNRNIEGTGLGLHITYRLVDMMEGRIEVQSVYGEGSTFSIYVPQTVVNHEPIGDFSKAVSAHVKNMELEESTLLAPDARILVVDDNDMNLDVMDGLLRDTKAKVDLVSSGMECIEKVAETKYDCILLDQMMPEMNGEMTLKELKSRDILGDTPIIALTADAIVGARENYLNMGFTDYLSKPVKYEKLEAALKEYLPPEKQLIKKAGDDDLPVMLIWGNDPGRLRDEKERLEGIYKCVCVVGSQAMEKYLEKHEPDGVMHVM